MYSQLISGLYVGCSVGGFVYKENPQNIFMNCSAKFQNRADPQH